MRDAALLTAAMRCYARQLQLCQPAQAYLASRGISVEAARRLGLGYSSGHGLHSWLTDAGFDGRRVLDSGLVSEGRERFRGMIVVPDLVQRARVNWLAGRAILPQVRPRFQALPGAKPVLGLSRLAFGVALDRRHGRPVRLARAGRLGPARRGRARRSGDGQAGFLPTGPAPRLARLRRRRGRTRSGETDSPDLLGHRTGPGS